MLITKEKILNLEKEIEELETIIKAMKSSWDARAYEPLSIKEIQSLQGFKEAVEDYLHPQIEPSEYDGT